MKLYEVTKYAWDNAIEIEFGKDQWNSETFTKPWFDEHYKGIWEVKGASGLYWFLIKDKKVSDLQSLKIPTNLPKNGTNIPEVATHNSNVFLNNLCKPNKDGWLVIYNGHEQNVFSRIRSHFALDNHGTTAIGLAKYNISNYDIQVKIFHNKLPMNDLSLLEEQFVMNILNEKVGREALESSWRAYTGWPVLCKR